MEKEWLCGSGTRLGLRRSVIQFLALLQTHYVTLVKSLRLQYSKAFKHLLNCKYVSCPIDFSGLAHVLKGFHGVGLRSIRASIRYL